MNSDEQKLRYPHGETLPVAGEALTVADGVRWLRMPLPFALNHVNLWLLRDRIDGREGWTVVDCGVDRPEVRACWETAFTQALEGLPVLRVVVTHMHPDHVGLAHWLCARWQVPLWMSMTDYVLARLWAGASAERTPQDGGLTGDSAVRHFARHGLVDPEVQTQIRARDGYYANLVPDIPSQFHRLVEGDGLEIGGRTWTIRVGRGHAPEHVSLWCPALRVLISGDMVLPRISTNVSVSGLEPEANPLRLYLNSLRELDDLPDDALVLPSHGRPFIGLPVRVAQQFAHHAARLAEVMDACRVPCSAYDLLPVLFHRKLDVHQLSFAMGESIAHLHALYFEGKLRRTLDEDGVYRFQKT
ncbi:MAG TPA: MBL fold metallo-hydrolase [Castellaniella sp.]|uniref:MBL fold metallo-hydrolase n=1 Tax=Castellaniella sp. TaxID=1955812 RepID=UPI002EF1DA81